MPRRWIRPTTSPFRRRRSASVTSLAVTTTMGMALEAGCDAYETKPVDLPKLLGTMEKLLEAQTGG